MKKIIRYSKFANAWWFLQDHPRLEKYRKFPASIEMALEIMVGYVNPKTNTVDDDENKNTKQEIWLEFGFPIYDRKNKIYAFEHDIRLDVGAPTFEEAFIKLAKLVKKFYQ